MNAEDLNLQVDGIRGKVNPIEVQSPCFWHLPIIGKEGAVSPALSLKITVGRCFCTLS